MGIMQLLPFVRNRYYVGKRLTSADFQTEQTYGRHKRQFLNQMTLGSGIVWGLGVYSLDDQSIMVEAGGAVDGDGRELVLEQPIVQKLSALDGFDQINAQQMVLCLGYQEKEIHPVYALQGQGEESYQCNQIQEGVHLFLREVDQLEPISMQPPGFFSQGILYADQDYQIQCRMPAVTPVGAMTKLELCVRRLRQEAEPVSVQVYLQIPAFVHEGQGHQIPVNIPTCTQAELTQVYHLRAQDTPIQETVLLVDADRSQVCIGTQTHRVRSQFALRASIQPVSAEALVVQAVSSIPIGEQKLDSVPLAQLQLQRTRTAYLIEKVDGMSVRRYIQTAARLPMQQELMQWFSSPGRQTTARTAALSAHVPTVKQETPLYATGICEIPLVAGLKRGQVVYSDELIHGLGKRLVWVHVGVETFGEDSRLQKKTRTVFYGNPSLFPQEDNKLPQVETGVKVMTDRGSFMVAVKLLEESKQTILPIRWVAMGLPTGEEWSQLPSVTGGSIVADPPTVVMEVRESRYFGVNFHNMEPCTLSYELTEPDSGVITSDGVYTAPGREGVYEIRISCTEVPLISTYAYAVVVGGNRQNREERHPLA